MLYFFVDPFIACAPFWGSGLDWVKSYMPRIIRRPVTTFATATYSLFFLLLLSSFFLFHLVDRILICTCNTDRREESTNSFSLILVYSFAYGWLFSFLTFIVFFHLIEETTYSLYPLYFFFCFANPVAWYAHYDSTLDIWHNFFSFTSRHC